MIRTVYQIRKRSENGELLNVVVKSNNTFAKPSLWVVVQRAGFCTGMLKMAEWLIPKKDQFLALKKWILLHDQYIANDHLDRSKGFL